MVDCNSDAPLLGPKPLNTSSTSIAVGWSPPNTHGGGVVLQYTLERDDWWVDQPLTAVYNGTNTAFQVCKSINCIKLHRVNCATLFVGFEVHVACEIALVNVPTNLFWHIWWSHLTSDRNSSRTCFVCAPLHAHRQTFTCYRPQTIHFASMRRRPSELRYWDPHVWWALHNMAFGIYPVDNHDE